MDPESPTEVFEGLANWARGKKSNNKQSKKQSAPVPGSKLPTSRITLGPEDYEKIVGYLEDPLHFTALFGDGRRTKVGGRCQTKITGYRIMAAELRAFGFPDMTGAVLQKKVGRYCENYRNARTMMEGTGAGLDQHELSMGMTIQEKVRKMCPHFERMHVLFGGRPNVDPVCTISRGLPSDSQVQSSTTNNEAETTITLSSDETDPVMLDDKSDDDVAARVDSQLDDLEEIDGPAEEDGPAVRVQASPNPQTARAALPQTRAAARRIEHGNKKTSPAKGSLYDVLQDAIKQRGDTFRQKKEDRLSFLEAKEKAKEKRQLAVIMLVQVRTGDLKILVGL
ncbi:hypothetical protein R1sor_026734 [Riccia sorocarpa]|uniref:Uncharacterized protein n=1 Tax=Riccia sorocarpa TaxID=122646 RepID=A0ABD3GDY5_9MARC